MSNIKLLRGAVGLLLIMVIFLTTVLLSNKQVMTKPSDPQPSPSSSPTQIDDPVIATIGEVEIRESMLDSNLYLKYGQELLNQMLDRLAIKMEAADRGITIEDHEMADELYRMTQGYDSEEEYFKSMKEQIGLTREELLEDIHYKLLLEKIATWQINVSDQEVMAYMEANSEEFQNYVEYNLQQIVTDSLEQAKKISALAKEGTAFDVLAKERSLDRMTAEDGGDLGWVDEADPFIPYLVMKSVSEMRVGEISEPILVDSDYYIVRLADRAEHSKGTPEQMHASVRKQLSLQKAPPVKDVVVELRRSRKTVILDERLRDAPLTM